MIIKKDKIDINLKNMVKGNDYYFKKEKLHIGINDNSITVTDITNSLKWGKQCLRYTINHTEETSVILERIQAVIDKYKLELSELLNDTVLNVIKTELKGVYDIEITFSFEERKGVYTYSPFVKIDKKRAVFPPKKFGRWQLIKFLLCGKIEATNEQIKSIVETPAKKQKTTLFDEIIVTFKAKDVFFEFLIEDELTELQAVA